MGSVITDANKIENLSREIKKILDSNDEKVIKVFFKQGYNQGFSTDEFSEASCKLPEDDQDKLAALGYPVRDLPENWESSID